MRKRKGIRLWVVTFSHRQLFRLTLIVFLLSFSVTTVWQLAVPQQYVAFSLPTRPSIASAESKAQWHWSELLVQGFPWLRSASPQSFLTPLQNLGKLASACFGFVPGEAAQTVMAGLPWLRAAAALPTQGGFERQSQLAPEASTVLPVLGDALENEANLWPGSEDVPPMADAAGAGSFSLLPVFTQADTAALAGDLAPEALNQLLNPDPSTQETAHHMLPASTPRTSDKPPVLLFHTHNAEAYQGSGDPRYVYNNDDRTVVHIGAVLAEKLRGLGVPVIHDQTHHMDSNFNLAYVQARKSVQKQMENSEFSMILDLHNDGTHSEVTTCELEGRSLARLLFVIGKADGIGSSWLYNEAFASAIHQNLETRAPGLSRGLYYEAGVRYNQDVHPASLIIEVGGNENSMDEALGSIDYLATILADLYFEGW